MKKSRYGAAFIILAALLFLFLVLNICIGSVNIPVSEIPKMLYGMRSAVLPVRKNDKRHGIRLSAEQPLPGME